MTNPYEAPSSPVEQASDYGKFDLDKCLSEPWEVTKKNLWLMALSSLVISVMIAGAALTIIGIFLLVPVLMWGLIRFYINLLDGEGDLADLFSGFQDYWQNTGQMLLLTVLMAVIGLVGNGLYYYALFTDNDVLTMVGTLVNLAFQFLVMCRFYYAGFLIVDRGMPAMDAIAASWQVSGRQWGMTILLAILAGILGGLGLILCLVGILVSMPFSYLMWGSAYRQVFGVVK